MELLCIAIKEELDAASKILENQLDQFKKEELNIFRHTNKVGNMTFLKYEVDESKKATKYSNVENMFKHYVANAISDIILETYQEKLISKIINDKCFYLSNYEKERIRNKTIDFLNKNEYITTEGIMYKISKKARILKAVIEYLDLNNEINIEGFVNFRLKFFVESIENAIEKNIEDFMIEKEFDEFIKVLQYFVEIQEPKIDVVNVMFKEDKYELYDGNKNMINNEFLHEIADELSESDINYDDLLISSLITIAPRNIKIHSLKNKERDIVKIIESVFPDKVEYCEDCNNCELCEESSLDIRLTSTIKDRK